MLIWLLLAGIFAIQEPGFKSVASVKEIMDAFVIPSSTVLFDAALEEAPDAARWAEIETNAIVLAESGNLLLLPSRAEGRDVWVEAAELLIQAGEDSLKAARARDIEEILFLGEPILLSCTNCHNEYLIE